MRCTIIIPVLNEAENIVTCLQPLQGIRQAGHEVIVVDGGSSDNTWALAEPYADHLLESGAGRARQMNAGASMASGDVLVFLHADTTLPNMAMQDIARALLIGKKCWGRFSVRLSGQQPLFRLVETMMNIRSCLTAIATGDQAMFIQREIFTSVGGFDEIPLMEDIAMSKKLKRYGRPACLQARVCTSSRRWEQQGILRTVLLMWSLRLRYWMGVSPEVLVQSYYRKPT